jgi:NitT/TauT family transport system substrate-binding protein
VFSEPGLCADSLSLVALRQVVITRGAAVTKLLKALLRADDFVHAHPDETRDIVQRVTKVHGQELELILKDQQSAVVLDQKLLLMLEDHARWMIAQKPAASRTMPNYLDFLHPEPLRALRPGSVSVLKARAYP